MNMLKKKEIIKKYTGAQVCPVTAAIDIIGGKWKPVIIWVLMEGPQRYGELHRRIPGVALKVLSRQLKELEADGVITRKAYPEVPPRVEYSLAAEGEKLRPIMEALAGWGQYQANRKSVS